MNATIPLQIDYDELRARREVAVEAHRLTPRAGAAASESETALRLRLGIPSDARQVLVLGETSHWDPNWLHTTEEYYEGWIPRILERVIEQLLRQPRRVFSLESL